MRHRRTTEKPIQPIQGLSPRRVLGPPMGSKEPDYSGLALLASACLMAAPFGLYATHSYTGWAESAFVGVGIGFFVGGLLAAVITAWRSKFDGRLLVMLFSAFTLSLILVSLALTQKDSFIGAISGVFGSLIVAFAAERGFLRRQQSQAAKRRRPRRKQGKSGPQLKNSR